MSNTPVKKDKSTKNDKQNSHDDKLTRSNDLVEDIDFTLLSPESLKRYKKAFKLKTKTSPKVDLIKVHVSCIFVKNKPTNALQRWPTLFLSTKL